MKLSKQDILTIQAYFKDKPVLKAFLFGSFARDEAVAGSDVDLLVELDYSKHIGMAFVSMKFDLEDRLNKPVDLVSSNSISQYIAPFINHNKQLIYER